MYLTSKELLKEMMGNMSTDDWCRYVEMSNKNLWTLQNNWMHHLEEKYGQEAALELDGLCYGRLLEVSAYRLKKFFQFGDDDLDTLAKVYQLTPSGSYIGIDFIRESENVLIRRVRDCPMQAKRLEEGLKPIECKSALVTGAANIARVINKDIKVTKVLCAPDPLPENLWCEVVYEI